MPDERLRRWQEAVAGDREAFAEFYARHVHRVYTHCRRRLDSVEDAQDATAEVFAIAWSRPWKVTYIDGVDILPWLIVTANNVSSSHRRTSARKERSFPDAGMSAVLPDHAEKYVADQEEREMIALALSVLDSLRPKDREIIELCVMAGLRPQELAGMHGSQSAVRSRLSRALGRARTLFEDRRRGPSTTAGDGAV